MKKLIFLFLILFVATIAFAGESVLRATASDVVITMDKNGNEYVRIIVSETKTLEGIQYTTGVPVMAFGDQVASAKKIKKGQKFTAVVSERIFEGRRSYTILAIK